MKTFNYFSLMVLLICSCQQQNVSTPFASKNTIVPEVCSEVWQLIHLDSLLFAGETAAEYLRSQVMEDGKFIYNRNVDDNVPVKKDYNVLRHAGTIYAMTQAYELHPEPKLKQAIFRAANFLKRETIAPLPGQPDDLLAVWSRPELIISNLPASNKLGGNGLALLALLSIEKMEPGFTGLDTLQGLGRFIQFMQKPDGSYYSKYFPESEAFDLNFTSLYYPGEAALGLFELYQLDAKESWLKTGLHFLTYMAEQRKVEAQAYQKVDHWALLATEKLFASLSMKLDEQTHQLLLDHAIQNARNIMSRLAPSPTYDNNYPIGGSGNVNMVATNMEGLLAMLPYLPEDLPDYSSFCTTAANGINYILQSQLKSGKYHGAFTKRPAFHPMYATNPKDAEIRIDNVQHSLSALIWMSRRLRPGS